MLVFTIALLCDLFFGDPVYQWHPVRLMGNLIQVLEDRLYPQNKSPWSLLLRGCALVFVVLLVVGVSYKGLLWALAFLPLPMANLLTALLMYQLFAARCLYDEGKRIRQVIQGGDLEVARREIGYLVSRNTHSLSWDDIQKAAVETLTENITDAIVAPMLYAYCFGLPGLALYKAVNTMDSMIAYKNDRYLYFGRVAARLDDVANWVPARLSAILITVIALVLKDDWKNSITTIRKDAKKHASPNAGYTEAAMAGALGIALSGPTLYFGQLVKRPWIGEKIRPITDQTLTKTMAYVAYAALLLWAILGVVSLW